LTVEVIRATSLGQLPHGFLGRRGGVSTGLCEGLNVGTGSSDGREAIAENRRRAIAAVLDGAALATVHQIHSAEAVFVERPWPQDDRPRADAMVTDRPGLLLGILTADCVPVLLADEDAGVVGAAHAGWRGALTGVIEATVAAMETLGAARHRMVAAAGPMIRQPNYEVGQELVDRFLADDAGNARHFAAAPRAGHALFDLAGYVVARLRQARVAEIEDVGLCTYADPALFFSYRRTTHRAERDYGRHVNAIVLAD